MSELPQAPYIDFDEASRAWKANKIRNSFAHYSYKCQATTLAGHECSRKADTANIFASGFFCKQHCPPPNLTGYLADGTSNTK